MISVVTHSAGETYKAGAGLGKILKGGEILALQGELGSGKTTFVKGLAAGLGVKVKPKSPTFVLMAKFDLPKRKNAALYHFDFYRLRQKAELQELGFTELLGRHNVIVIEWAEKIHSLLPANTIYLKFEHISRHKRQITLYDAK